MLMMQTIFAVCGAYYYRQYKSNAITDDENQSYLLRMNSETVLVK